MTSIPAFALILTLAVFTLAAVLEQVIWLATGLASLLKKVLVWVFSPLRWLVSGFTLLAVLAATPVWAGWLWGPDPKFEAANQALERAAQIATEAARTQTSQHEKFLATLEALSTERTQLAGHLSYLAELTTRDSAWASVLHTAGPGILALACLVVAALALWMTTRAGSHDADLASVLVEELVGTSPVFSLSPRVFPQVASPNLNLEELELATQAQAQSTPRPKLKAARKSRLTPTPLQHQQHQQHQHQDQPNHTPEDQEMPF